MEEVLEKIQVKRYPAYKESGVEWLGEIPSHWEVKALKHIAYLESGKTISAESFTDTDGYPVFGGNGFRGHTSTYTNDGSFALIGRQGALCGNVNYAHGKFYASEHAIVVYPLNNENYYWLGELIRLADFNRLSQSAAQPGIAISVIKNVQFPYPPFHEQTAIAAFLDRKTAQIDNAIRIKERQIELLKERRQILIQNAVTRGLSPGVKMKESGIPWIGSIPEHWEVKKNNTLFEERREQGHADLPLLSISIHSAVSSEELDGEENIQGRVRIENKESYSRVMVGDIAFNMMRAWQGAIGAVQVEGMVSPAYIVAKPKQSFNSLYLEYLFRTPMYIAQINRSSKGITDFRKRLYWNEFKQIDTLLPPEREQDQIVAFISSMSDKTEAAIVSNEKEIEKLKEYKATLIDGVVTGKVRVYF